MSWARRVALFLFGPIALYLVIAVLGAVVPGPRAQVANGDDTAWIVLVQGPIHYDILLPLDEQTRMAFDFLPEAGVPTDLFSAAWLSVGWGSEAFYTTAGSYADITPGAVVQAVTGDSGVMRFEVYGPLPVHPSLRRVAVSPQQLDLLRDHIRGQVQSTTALPISGFSDTDGFFAAQGRFNIFKTCNVWVGRALGAAGLETGIWTPTPYAVTLSLWWNGHLESTGD